MRGVSGAVGDGDLATRARWTCHGPASEPRDCPGTISPPRAAWRVSRTSPASTERSRSGGLPHAPSCPALDARPTRHTVRWSRAVHQRASDRGLEHAHAIRVLGRAWCRVRWTCWQTHVAYDPTRHRATRQFHPSPRRPGGRVKQEQLTQDVSEQLRDARSGIAHQIVRAGVRVRGGTGDAPATTAFARTRDQPRARRDRRPRWWGPGHDAQPQQPAVDSAISTI